MDMIKNGEISLVINTVEAKRQARRLIRHIRFQPGSIRTSALAAKVTVYTTIEGARAACTRHAPPVRPRDLLLQGLHAAGSRRHEQGSLDRCRRREAPAGTAST